MSFELPALPYARDALEPYISANTLDYHYGKHHKGYVDKLNKAIADAAYAGQSLEEIIAGARDNDDSGVFKNAAQAWNHEFLWHSMSPNGGGEPAGELAEAIAADFGGFDQFCDQFKAAALGRFGSGWAWLVQSGEGLDIVTTGNADTPIGTDATPLLTLDVWEHAYYLDYQNQRGTYIDTFLGDLINWEFAGKNFAADRAAA
jgi:Fe-Mn family superoxide dismutase